MVWRDLGLNTGFPDHWRILYPLDHSLWIYLSFFKFCWIMNTRRSHFTNINVKNYQQILWKQNNNKTKQNQKIKTKAKIKREANPLALLSLSVLEYKQWWNRYFAMMTEGWNQSGFINLQKPFYRMFLRLCLRCIYIYIYIYTYILTPKHIFT